MRAKGHRLVKAAASTPAKGSDLGAVEHVVFLMQENRSFDHYFGMLGGVDGFDASSSAFAQAWPGGASSTLLPYHLDISDSMAECTFDLSHEWGAEHGSWNNGAMDSFVSTNLLSTWNGSDAAQLGPLTMGYYGSADIPFYYALAKAFTICDRYFSSVLGPTHPNRLLQMTGTLDPAGVAGGPILETGTAGELSIQFTCSWSTMPEVLTDAGVTWKLYNPYGSLYTPGGFISPDGNNPLMYFEQYKSTNSGLYQNAFGYYGPSVPTGTGWTSSTPGPDDFASDVKSGNLPQVSWVIPPIGYDEHPPAPASLGEWFTAQVLKNLMSNKDIWESTVLFVMYDENDGFFDHVPPPTAPEGTPGEYVTATSRESSYTGPIGMGMRVPMLVVSPFSAGGWVCSDTFDHTSQLQFLKARFGVELPNISSWRLGAVGDLTSTLPILKNPDTKRPKLPPTSDNIKTPPIKGECSSLQLVEINPTTFAYPIPKNQAQPTQEPGTLKPTPS